MTVAATRPLASADAELVHAHAHALRMARALTDHNLRPALTLHPSWLPADWPAPYRQPRRYGADGGDVLNAVLRQRLPDLPDPTWAFDADFALPRKRLALLDGAALRQLAWYCGVALHRGLLQERRLGRELRRQTRRFGSAGAEYVLRRLPDADALRANPQALTERPLSCGRVVWRRGARALLALMTQEQSNGGAVLGRVRLKLPRRLAAGELPRLGAAQLQQLDEVVRMSIVPERLPQWDWLF